MVTMPGTIESYSPEGEEQTRAITAREPAPYKPDMGLQVKPGGNPYEAFTKDTDPAESVTPADTSWKERFVQHFNNAQRYGTPGVNELTDIRDAQQGYVGGVQVGKEAAQATANLRIDRRAESVAAYENMPSAQGPLDYAAAIGGEIAGTMADPASLLGAPVKIGTAGWRMAYPFISRMLESSVSNAAMNAAVNATVQAEEYGAGQRNEVDWLGLGMDAAAGAAFGLPFGAAEGSAASRLYAEEAQRAGGQTPAAPYEPAVPRETPPITGMETPTPEQMQAEFTPAELSQAQVDLFGEVIGTRNLTPEQIGQLDNHLNGGKAADIPQAPPETEGGLTNDAPIPPPPKPDLSIDPAQYKGKESTPALHIGGKYFTGPTHADALARAVEQFGVDSPEIKAFEAADNPLTFIGIVKPKKGFVAGITGGSPEDLTRQIDDARNNGEPNAGSDAAPVPAVPDAAPTENQPVPQVPVAGQQEGPAPLPDSVLKAIADIKETPEGVLPLAPFTEEERAALRQAGLVKTVQNAEGTTYEAVESAPLWDARQKRAAEIAAQPAAPITAAERAQAIETRAQSFDQAAVDAEQAGDAGKADAYRAKAAEIRGQKPPLPPIPYNRTRREFAPSELKVDAKRFQFKDGGDDAGVTDRLKGVKKWDDTKSGVTLVWEDLKGDFYIADGHQRHGLATRLEKEGQQPKIHAVVLREADGVSSEEARAIAAAKNIAEGTGNAIDAAKILRSRPDMGVDLPPTSALVRDAQGLAALSDDAFGMVINKKVPAGYAAQVGRLAPDPKTHSQLLDLLAKEQPDNAIEAESMIRDALDAPAVQSTMEDMFGSAEVTQILFKERAQVLSAAATAIRKDRAAFATLVREEARLTGAGNKLATQSNAERASQDAEILATLQAQARRKGPVADALAAAAKRLNDGESRPAVVRDFLDNLRRSDAPASPDGGLPGPAGRADQGIAASLGGYRNTDQPAFKKWFGDSKVVDDSGAPLVVYHGGPKGIDAFDLARAGDQTNATNSTLGVFLTNDNMQADSYAGRRGEVYELYASIETPIVLQSKGFDVDASGPVNDAVAEHVGKSTSDLEQADFQEWKDWLKARGHDGVEVRLDDGLLNFIVFEPTQIKSIYNRGTWDATEPNIAFSRRPAPAGPSLFDAPPQAPARGDGAAGRADETGIAASLGGYRNTDQPAFKKWFGTSKVVDENGEPLVVYHGTGPTSFGEFKLDAAKKFDKGFFGADGFYLTPQRYLADAYSMQRGGTAANTMELYVSIENPLWLHGSTTQPDEIVENLQRALVKHFGDQAQADEVMRRITGGKTALEIQNLLFAEETSARGEEAATWESHGGLHSSTILDEFRKNIIPEVRKLGYDGIFAGTVWNKDYTHRVPSEIVAFDPTQIKSATGNSGDFDPNEPAIAFSRRPVQEGPGLFDTGADNKPQAVIPGAEQISDKSLAERRAAAPLRASKPQKSMDVGLFGSEADQKGFAFSTQTIGTGLPDMIARGAPIEEISAHPVVQEAVRRLDAIPLTNEQPGFMSDSWKAARIYDFEDGPVQGFDKAIDRLEEGAKAFSKAGPVKNERRAIIVMGPPAAGKSTFAERFATERYAAIVDPDEAKKVIPEFQGGIGANAVHEESADMANAVLDHLLDEGSNLVIPKVGHSASGIRKLVQRLKRDGYQVDLVNIAVSYDNAFRRMIGRFIKTGRIINPEYVKAVGISPAETYRLLKQEGVADRYAEIDANGRAGDPPQVLDNTGALEGLSGFGGDRKPLLGTDVRGQGQAPEQAAPPDSGVAFARRPQQGTMPSNRPQAGTVATGNAASPPLAPRLEDIGADLRTLTGAPVRQGRLQRAPAGGGKVAGQYDRDQGVIRLRENPDFETQVHETAHSLETEWGRSLNTIKLAGKAELEPLAYAGADPRQTLSEGFAEWFRFYVTTPGYARNQAPGFTAAFEDMLRTRAPEQLAAIQKIQADYRAHIIAPSRAAVAGDVVSTRRGNAVTEAIKEAQGNGIRATMSTYASTAYTALLDKLNPINKAVDELAKIYEKRTGRAMDITSAQDPYRLARLLQDSYSAGHMDMVHGVVPYHGVAPEGPSLSDALALAFHDGWSGWNERDMADFASYLISRRAVWEYDRFLADQLPNPPGKFTKGDYETTIAELEAQYPQWVQAADMVYEWQKNFLRKKKDAGFITEDLYNELIQRPAYVPFMRDLTDLDKEVGREGNATLRNSIVKAFKGSKRSIINPIESMMADAYHFNALLRRNDVFKALEDLGRMAGPGGGSIVERIPSSELKGTAVNVNEVLKVAGKEAGLNPNDIDSLTTMVDDLMGEDARATVFRAGEINEKGEPIVYVWRNGKKQALRLPDGDFGRELFDSMTGMNKESRDLFVSILALPSSALRYSITTSPPFVLANYIRDQVSAWVLSGETFIPFVTGARGLRDEIMQNEISRIYNSFGGIMGGANVASLHKGRMKRDISALQKKGYAIKRFAGISGFAQFTELTETGTRLGIFGNAYKRAKKEGLSDYEAAVEAAYQARDYIDFGRHGSKTHAARRLVTFINASVQGLDKTFRVLTAEGALRKAITPYVNHRAGRPLSARDKANLGRSAKAWAALTAVGVFGLGLRTLYKDDPEYEEISDYLRATNWMIKVRPGEWIAVPKPFELGFVSNLFERSFEAIYQRNPVAMESFWSGLFEITAPPSVVPIFDVGYQLAHNVDSYGRPIVGQDIAGYEPWRQYTAQTSALAKGMGYATNTSPAMIDHAIQGFGASWGKIITDISRDTAQERGPVATMTGALTRRFVKDVASGSVSSAAFWGQMSETSGPMAQTANTYKDIFENQGPAAGNAFLETKDDNLKAYAMLTTHFDAKVERLHPMRRAKDAVSAISSLRKEIAGNDVTPVGSDPEDHERIIMTPDQRHGVQELLARLAMVEARNALVTTGIRGFAQKQYMDTETIKQDIATLSPQLGEELTARYEKKKIYDEAAVREAWPDVKQRILTDGQDANFDDITSGMGAGQ